MAVDTEGNLWAVHVHAANGADTVEGCVLADMVLAELPGVEALCADKGYRGAFVDYVKQEWERDVHVSGREGKGFELEPRRWVVERTFAWFNVSVTASAVRRWLTLVGRVRPQAAGRFGGPWPRPRAEHP